MDPGRDKSEMTLAESVEYVIHHLSGDVVTLREILDVIGRLHVVTMPDRHRQHGSPPRRS
jgi:hypothetical protein